MKIIIAPDSFKGVMPATQVATHIANSLSKALPTGHIIPIPMSDGGEGMLDALAANINIQLKTAVVHDPIGVKITTHFGILEDNTAIIEMAKASGLSLISKEKRNPLYTNTFGTGELILAALEAGCRRFIIGLGGSATSDGGIGALTALGVQFKNNKNQEMTSTIVNLNKLTHIDTSAMDPRLQECQFTLACDVNNPILGPKGVTLYAAQKGASHKDIGIIAENLAHYVKIIQQHTAQTYLELPFGGAAGGLATGLFAFLNTTLKPGAPVIMDLVQFEDKIKTADLIITAEGQIDAQSIHGKTPIAVATLAKKYHIPVIAIAAMLSENSEEIYQHGINAAFSFVNGPISRQECIKNTIPLLTNTAYNIGKVLAVKDKK